MKPSSVKHFIIAGDLMLLQAGNVHVPDSYSGFLAQCIDLGDAATGCDLTTGSGYHALCMAANGLRTVAIDRSAAAVSLARRNSIINSLEGAVDIRQGNLYDALGPGERFDCMVAWPPVMPVPRGEETRDWWSLANSGGPTGRGVLDAVIRGASAHLSGEGSLWMAQPWYISVEETRKLAVASGLECREVATKRFPLGTISRSRLPYIASLGFRPPREDGRAVHELTVFRFTTAAGTRG